MATKESVMQRLVSTVNDFIADENSSQKHPYAGKLITTLALFGGVCLIRNLLRYSRPQNF